MVATTKIQMERMAGYGADKIMALDSLYTIRSIGDGHFKVINPEGKHYVVVPQKATNGASHCRCPFHTENRKVYGAETTCKHVEAVKRFQDEEARIIAMTFS